MSMHDIVDGGFAACAAAADGTTVKGVAIGEGDVSNGLSGKRTRWPGDVLAEAADKLVGKPITRPESSDPEQHVAVEQTDDGVRPTGAVPLDAKVGEVTDAYYEPGEGLLFEGEVSDPDAKTLVERGLAQVSPVLYRDLDETDDGAFEATEIHAFRDLGLVADGAMPSNQITAAAEALSRTFDTDLDLEALTVSRPDYNGYADDAWDAPTLSGTYDGDMDAARNAATWIDGEGETFGDLSLFVVDGAGDLNLNALDSAWRLASQTDGPTEDDVERLRSLYEGLAVQARDAGALSADEFDSVWEDRVQAEAGAQAQDDDHPGSDDGPHDDSGQSASDSGRRTAMSDDDLTEKQRELLAVAGQKDDPTVVEADRLEALANDEELIDAAAEVDDPTVVSESEFEALQGRVEVVEGMLNEALVDQRGLKEATVEAMNFRAKAAEFEDDEGALELDALAQQPETGAAPDAGDGDGNTGVDDDAKDRIAEIDQKLDLVGSALPAERVEALQQEAADLADVDDYDAALEVL